MEKSPLVASTFPLRHIKVEYRQIKMDLNKITLKEVSVVSMKTCVKEKVDRIGEKLCIAKSDWAGKLVVVPSLQAEKTGVQFSTGKSPFS